MKMPRFITPPTRHDEIAKIDTTGGTVEAIKLDANHVPKVLLRIVKNGVFVEMALSLDEAGDFADDFGDALAWVSRGGRDA